MIWRKHLDRVPNVLIPNAKILSKKACDATLGKPNRSFVAFLDNIMTTLIRTHMLIRCLRQIVNTPSSM
jgi:hypothetical protein